VCFASLDIAAYAQHAKGEGRARVTRSDTFKQMLKEARSRRGVALLGVCNVTPDSFSENGSTFQTRDACARVDELVLEGADAVDIGAESTRPGAKPVAPAEQLRRMLDVVRYAAQKTRVSVDTTSPEVARACLEAGAIAVNDVSCLKDDDLARTVHGFQAAYILMHTRGSQSEMAGFSVYQDAAYGNVVADVVAEWSQAAGRAWSLGVPKSAMVMDPGLGFAKNARHSAELLRGLDAIVREVGVPVLIGASRKSFLKAVDGDAGPTDRLGASVAAALHAVAHGASLLRVHDVRATRQAIDLSHLLASPGTRAAEAEGAGHA
jgi:dihydropteroate synthase